MSKDPAVLFYTGDFLNGCTGLTLEERGQYITLLCLQHQQGHLPEKTIRLSVGSVSVDVMKKFIQDSEGNFFNERMDEEINKRKQFIETRRVNGQKGGRPSKANDKPNGYPIAKANEKLIENENENDNYSLKEEEIVKRRRKPFVPPTKEEVRQFFSDNGYDPDFGATRWEYYNDANWFDAKGDPVLNWKQKIRAVWFKPEHKKKSKSVFG